jgi:hypothetical protein
LIYQTQNDDLRFHINDAMPVEPDPLNFFPLGGIFDWWCLYVLIPSCLCYKAISGVFHQLISIRFLKLFAYGII